MTIPASIQNWPGKSRISVSCRVNVQVPLAKKMRWNSVKNCSQPEGGECAQADDDHERDDGAGEQPAPDSAGACAAAGR